MQLPSIKGATATTCHLECLAEAVSNASNYELRFSLASVLDWIGTEIAHFGIEGAVLMAYCCPAAP
jgi:hypothetical protein